MTDSERIQELTKKNQTTKKERWRLSNSDAFDSMVSVLQKASNSEHLKPP